MGTELARPDFVGLAESFGIPATTTDPADLTQALRTAWQGTGYALWQPPPLAAHFEGAVRHLIIEDHKRLGVHNPGQGLDLFENNPAEIGGVPGSNEQDHIHRPTGECHLPNLGDG